MKKIVFFIILSASVIFFACKTEDPPSPIFHDVKEITITKSGSILTFHNVPSEAVYFVIGFFSSDIQVSDSNFINDSNLVSGSRTGLGLNGSSFDTSQAKAYNPSTQDFNTVLTPPVSGRRYAIWGYNSSGVLMCGSGQYLWP